MEIDPTGLADEDIVSEGPAAKIVKLSVSTLQKKRVLGTGPKFLKLSDGRTGAVRYRVGDLRTWLRSRQVSSTSEQVMA